MERPLASVVIPASRPDEDLAACLEALEGGTVSAYEAIVIDSSPGGEARALPERFPRVRVIRPDRPLPPHEARNRGAGLASGETIVFTDADCVPRPDWLERLLDGHRLGAPLIGGAIDPDGGGIVERGADICKFALWLEGLPGGERETLPTANLSLTRETWARIGPFRLLAWSGDTELCRRARREGVPLHFEPRAIVRHEDPVRLGRFLRERRQRGSAYAALRIELESWPRLRSAAYAAGSPAIAVWLAARGAWAAARSGRALTALVSLPVSAAGFVAWSLGEAGAYGRHAVGRLSSGDGRPGSPPHGG